MNYRSASRAAVCLLLLGASLTLAPAAVAQHEAGQTQGPSKYIFLSNIAIKPNQSGAYAKIQADEIQAMRAAKAPNHYVAMWSITGSNHVIAIHGFDSFADLQKSHDDTVAMSKLMETMRADDAEQAATIAETHSSIYRYDKDLSLNPNVDLSKMRFMRILLFQVRAGRDEDFQHVVKLFAKAYEAIPEARWAMFEKMYGVGSSNTYILVTPMESLATVDYMAENSKKFTDATGKDQLAILRNELNADVDSEEANLFAFGSGISYVPDSWISSSPDFWGKK
ncbi:MAG: hypothetical protein KGN79_12250 [Acidobacteriota bacterium]|nr:hypothetical protein [Acidobacteriota bacterium]